MSEPTKRPRGRQPGAVIVPPAEQRKRRVVFVNDARWAKFEALGGRDWLEETLDRAKPPASG